MLKACSQDVPLGDDACNLSKGKTCRRRAWPLVVSFFRLLIFRTWYVDFPQSSFPRNTCSGWSFGCALPVFPSCGLPRTVLHLGGTCSAEIGLDGWRREWFSANTGWIGHVFIPWRWLKSTWGGLSTVPYEYPRRAVRGTAGVLGSGSDVANLWFMEFIKTRHSKGVKLVNTSQLATSNISRWVEFRLGINLQ